MENSATLIKAEDLAGCDLISSLIQDSIFHLSFHSFHKEQKRFRLMLNRFCWESVKDFEKEGCYYRVHSGLYIHNVDSIIANDDVKKDRYLNLLTFHASEKEINMVFSDNKHICIKINGVLVYLKDLHDRYPTTSLPTHEDNGKA
ncbi:MAG: DUF2948 family protein [Holosporaceae bacterium]|jgi:hypothetical protein|nr:DUF2948 family protein [Holosporaceae bacterium]